MRAVYKDGQLQVDELGAALVYVRADILRHGRDVTVQQMVGGTYNHSRADRPEWFAWLDDIIAEFVWQNMHEIMSPEFQAALDRHRTSIETWQTETSRGVRRHDDDAE